MATETIDPSPPTTSTTNDLPDSQSEDPSASTPTTLITTTTTALTTTTDPSTTQPASTNTSTTKKTKKVIRVKKKRPARVQVDPATAAKQSEPIATGTIYNIWYNKWSGGDSDQYAQHAAPARCSLARDAGYTRADGIGGQPSDVFCVYFARGVCTKGRDCEFLHRLPGLHDIFGPNVDCFGRDKFADYRDDMGGVGSFMKQNRTLYVGKIHVTDDIEEIVARHFSEWGDLERIRVLNMRGIAFVTYTHLANAEFAKEAMAHQALDHAEVLNVRWATTDPNPHAQRREARAVENQAAQAIRRALPPEYVAEIEGRDPDARKRRRVEGAFGLDGYQAPEEVWFAKQKGEWVARQRAADQGLRIGEEQRVLRLGDAAENMHLGEDGRDVREMEGDDDQEDDGGIFASSTLTALKNRKSVSKNTSNTASKPVSNNPLVAYGSDSDDDDDDD